MEKLENRPKTSMLLLLVLVGGVGVVISQFGVVGSLANDDHSPSVEECSYDSSSGDITGGCDIQGEAVEIGGYRSKFSGLKNGETKSQSFWVRVNDIDVQGDEKSPVFYYLYANGYTNDATQKEIDEGDFPRDVDLSYGELEYNSQIEEGLEKGSTCQGSFQIGMRSEVNIKTTEGESEWNDEPDEADERSAYDFYPSTKTFDAEDVRVRESYVACKFSMTEILNEGMTPSGDLVYWNGVEPDVGDNGGTMDISFDFEEDSDGDGTLDENDKCRDEPGNKSNGCPNSEPEITGIQAPENATQGETVTLNAVASDSDGDSLNYEWSNGDSGPETKVKADGNTESITVTVSDGSASVNRTASFSVSEKTGINIGTGSDADSDSPQETVIDYVIANLTVVVLGTAVSLFGLLLAYLYRRRGG